MLLILSTGNDVATDIIVKRLGDFPVFRFDIDKWHDYAWYFNAGGFSLTHPNGTVCTHENLKGVYLSNMAYFNPIDVPAGACEENWHRQEVCHLFADQIAFWHAAGLMPLVHPGNGRWDKIRQMREAAKYFKVPEWCTCRGKFAGGLKAPVVVSTLTQPAIGEGKFGFVRETDVACLDPQYPWFLREKVPANANVTALYIRGKLFAFEADRRRVAGDDRRLARNYKNLSWKPFALSESEQFGMRELMKTMGFDFGRFDFLRRAGELWFLEFNPNGQWAWLDDYSEVSLADLVCRELM